MIANKVSSHFVFPNNWKSRGNEKSGFSLCSSVLCRIRRAFRIAQPTSARWYSNEQAIDLELHVQACYNAADSLISPRELCHRLLHTDGPLAWSYSRNVQRGQSCRDGSRARLLISMDQDGDSGPCCRRWSGSMYEGGAETTVSRTLQRECRSYPRGHGPDLGCF